MLKWKVLLQLGVLLTCLSWPTPQVEASQVRSVALDHLCHYSGSIFVATVDHVEVRPDSAGVLSTFYYLNITQAFYGVEAGPTVIKVYGGATADIVSTIPGMPTLKKGEEHFLFLLPESEHGFTSPVGLFQGNLPILRAKDGTPWVSIPDNISQYVDRYPIDERKRRWLSSRRMTPQELGSVVIDILNHQAP